jgi:hypothetical protein
MLALGLVLNAVGIGLFDRQIFTLAVYALPFLRPLMPAFWPSTQAPAYTACRQLPSRPRHVPLWSFEFAFAMRRSLTLRVIIAAVFALPATFAGYHAVPAMARIGVPSLVWREVFAWVGAIFIGGTACMRLAVFTEPRPVERAGWSATLLSQFSQRASERDDLSPSPSNRFASIRARVFRT